MSRHQPAQSSSATTLRGSGWLREAPTNLVPREWLEIRGRSALRKCMFLPSPLVPPFAPYAKVFAAEDAASTERREREESARSIRRNPTPIRSDARVPRRLDPMRQARIFPAVVRPRPLNEVIAPYDNVRVDVDAAAHAQASPVHAPLVMGALLIFAPPAGLAAVWTHPRFDRDAKWALTVSTMFFMALATALVFALAR